MSNYTKLKPASQTQTFADALIPVKIDRYKNDMVLSYTAYIDPVEHTRGDRRPIVKLSKKSLERMVFYAQNTAVKFVGMITLTYPNTYPESGKIAKKHLNRFLVWAKKAGLVVSYLWFLEFQKRGAPHFHILTSSDPTDRREDVSMAWYRAVGSDDPKHLRAGTRCERLRKPDAAGRYAAKYAAKKEQKFVPSRFRDVGRFWGCSTDVPPIAIETIDVLGLDRECIADTLEGMGWERAPLLKDIPLKYLYNAGKETEKCNN